MDNKTGTQGNAGPSGITELLFGVNVYEIVEERQIPASVSSIYLLLVI
jgi:hypothetical protein